MPLRVVQAGSGATRPLVLVYLLPKAAVSFQLPSNVAIVADTGPNQAYYDSVPPLDATLATLSQQLDASFSPVVLCGFSAGGFAVRHILNLGGDPDAVVLADGVYGTDIAAWTAYAQRAIRGERVFAASHSSNVFMEPGRPSPWRNLRSITGFNLPLGNGPGVSPRPPDAPVTQTPIFTESGNAIVYSYPDLDHQNQGDRVLPTILVPKAFDLLGMPESPPSTAPYWWAALFGSIAGLAGFLWWQHLHEPRRIAPAYAELNPAGSTITVRVDRLYAWRPKLEETLNDIQAGRLSFSSHEPLRVSRLDSPRGGFFILDGHHRAIEAVLAGRTTIQAVIDPEMPRIERTGGAHRSIVEAKMSVVEFMRTSAEFVGIVR